MKNKRKAILCALSVMGLTVLVTPVAFAQDINVSTEAVGSPNVEPRAYIREWRYKVMNGHVYKRLYNRTTGEWESDWILVQ